MRRASESCSPSALALGVALLRSRREARRRTRRRSGPRRARRTALRAAPHGAERELAARLGERPQRSHACARRRRAVEVAARTEDREQQVVDVALALEAQRGLAIGVDDAHRQTSRAPPSCARRYCAKPGGVGGASGRAPSSESARALRVRAQQRRVAVPRSPAQDRHHDEPLGRLHDLVDAGARPLALERSRPRATSSARFSTIALSSLAPRAVVGAALADHDAPDRRRAGVARLAGRARRRGARPGRRRRRRRARRSR